jgi:hypothetical protein
MLTKINQFAKYNAVDDGFGNITMVSAAAWESSYYFSLSI